MHIPKSATTDFNVIPDSAWKIAPPIPLPMQASPHAEAAEDFGTTSAVRANTLAV